MQAMEVLMITYFGFDAFVHILVMMLTVMLTDYDAYIFNMVMILTYYAYHAYILWL